jgi:hypothetical protein
MHIEQMDPVPVNHGQIIVESWLWQSVAEPQTDGAPVCFTDRPRRYPESSGRTST